MIGLLQYKQYHGSVSFCEESKVFHGKLIGIRGLISYEGDSPESLEADFRKAIDFYLSCCEAEGWKPALPFDGDLRGVVIPSDMHKNLYIYSSNNNKSPETVLEEALKQYIG